MRIRLVKTAAGNTPLWMLPFFVVFAVQIAEQMMLLLRAKRVNLRKTLRWIDGIKFTKLYFLKFGCRVLFVKHCMPVFYG